MDDAFAFCYLYALRCGCSTVVVWVLNSQGSGDRTRALLTPVPELRCEASDVASIHSLDENKAVLGRPGQ
jgi:hypothetical protein